MKHLPGNEPQPKKKRTIVKGKNKSFGWQILKSSDTLLQDTARKCALTQIYTAASFLLWSSSFAKTLIGAVLNLTERNALHEAQGRRKTKAAHSKNFAFPFFRHPTISVCISLILFPFGIPLLSWNNKRSSLLMVFSPCRRCERASVLVISG